MKNNKYAPYILGIALVIIWGLVFYKIYIAVYGGHEVQNIPSFHNLPIYQNTTKDNSFALLLDYKDPFLGKEFSKNQSSTTSIANNSSSISKISSNSKNNNPFNPKNKQPSTTNINPPIPQKPFPPIIYQGFQIMDTDTIAILKIDGKFYPNARKGQYLNSVGIQAIYTDSIQLLFEGKQQTFNRKK